MSHTPFSEFWCSLLFNLVSFHFVELLIALIANQVISVRNYNEAQTNDSSTTTLVGDTLF